MSTKKKYFIAAFFFFLITLGALLSMVKNGFSSSMVIYTLIPAGICFLYLKNALRL
jgi:hypothetical protein